MLISIAIIALALAWLMRESNWLRVRLAYGKPASVKLLKAGPVYLQLPAGNPDGYPMSRTFNLGWLKDKITELSRQELEIEGD